MFDFQTFHLDTIRCMDEAETERLWLAQVFVGRQLSSLGPIDGLVFLAIDTYNWKYTTSNFTLKYS